MPSTYRRPGVYLQESLLLNPSDVAGTTTVAAFIGLALKGPVNVPVLIESWSDYSTIYGGFDPIPPPVPAADPLNLTGTVFPLPADVPTNLAALKAHATKGDGDITTPEFTAGAHIILKDASKAHYTPLGATGVWAVGPMPGTVPLEPSALSYLPFAVYSFFQNGGRFAWIVRAAELETGVASTIGVMDAGAVGPPVIAARQSFKLTALSPGKWGDNIGYRLLVNSSEPRVFSLEILQKSGATDWETMERFQNLSVRGTIAGSRRVDSALNDSLGGSRYVKVTNLDLNVEFPLEKDDDPVALAGGGDPGWPDIDDLSGAPSFLGGVEGPLMVNVCSYLNNESFRDRPGELDDDDDSVLVGTTFSPTIFPDREDVMVINDYSRAKDYTAQRQLRLADTSGPGGRSTSYTAAYGPWILVPHPTQVGAVIPIPPGGAIMGVDRAYRCDDRLPPRSSRRHRHALQRCWRAGEVHRHRTGRPQPLRHQHHPACGRCWHLCDGCSYSQELRP